jgi:hypothetical protein
VYFEAGFKDYALKFSDATFAASAKDLLLNGQYKLLGLAPQRNDFAPPANPVSVDLALRDTGAAVLTEGGSPLSLAGLVGDRALLAQAIADQHQRLEDSLTQPGSDEGDDFEH